MSFGASQQGTVLIIVVLAVAAVVISWLIPKLSVSRLQEISPKDRHALENESRRTIVQLFGGLVLLLGLTFTWINVNISRSSQVADRFNKAIEFLGSRTPAVRAGGVYALERLMNDAPEEHWRIVEVLTQYIRQNSHRPDDGAGLPTFAQNDDPSRLTRLELEAAIRIIGRRKTSLDPQGSHIDLSAADLSNISLPDADFSDALLGGASFDTAELHGAKFNNANLDRASFVQAQVLYGSFAEASLKSLVAEGANFQGCDFGSANLFGARLHKANLYDAKLNKADLTLAKFEEADFRKAEIGEADFANAALKGANFEGVDLSKAQNLTAEQLNEAKLDSQTKLPGGITWKRSAK